MLEVFEHFCKNFVCYLRHPPQRQCLQVRCHSTQLTDESVTDPIVIFEVYFACLVIQVRLKSFLCQYCMRKSSQIVQVFRLFVAWKLDIIQLSYDSPYVVLVIRFFTYQLRLGFYGRTMCDWIHLIESCSFSTVAHCSQYTNSLFGVNVIILFPAYCIWHSCSTSLLRSVKCWRHFW